MRLLLDTHIWLWALLEPERLSERVTREIQDSANELWLSPISVWELIVLWQKKRVLRDENVESWIPEALRALSVAEAPVNYEVSREIARLKLPQGDPADRFLVATARVFELTLVTADKGLLRTREAPILANL